MFGKFNLTEMLNDSIDKTGYQVITKISQQSFAVQMGIVLVIVWMLVLVIGLLTGATHAKSGNFWIIWIFLAFLFFLCFVLFYTGVVPYNFSLPYS